MLIKSPFEDLMEEHVALVTEMGDLLGSIRELTNQEKMALGGGPGMLRNSLEILQYRLRMHFRREEEGLYPEAQRIISEGARGADIFGRFFAEEAEEDMGAHGTLTKRINEMLAVMADLDTSGATGEAATRKLQALGNATAGLLQRHAEKEDTMIFPMIERSLTPIQVGQVSERLEKIGSARDLTGESSEEGLSQLGG